VGRGGAYPTLSVSLGEQAGMVGALSIEAAARHLNTRDIDGIVLAEGFSLRVVDAFLTVLAEDARFRHLPIVVTSPDLAPSYELPNLEILSGEPAQMVATALPLIRQHAFEAHLGRTLKSIDTEGLIDARTGLLTSVAFERDFASAIYQTQQRGGGLSAARFAFDPAHPRAQFDGARIISRLMRQMDFGAVFDDGAVVIVFAETDLKTAHAIARRLSSVMRHTSHGKRDNRTEPVAAGAARRRVPPRRVVIVPSHPAGTSPAVRNCRSTIPIGGRHEENCLDHGVAGPARKPGICRGSQDRRRRACGSEVLDGIEGRNVLFEAEGSERLQPEG
jgi:hypothetical protein